MIKNSFNRKNQINSILTNLFDFLNPNSVIVIVNPYMPMLSGQHYHMAIRKYIDSDEDYLISVQKKYQDSKINMSSSLHLKNFFVKNKKNVIYRMLMAL